MNHTHAAGTILGLAIGDALGYPTEFRTRELLLRCFGPNGVEDMVSIDDDRFVGGPIIVGAHQPAGTFSDDTQMTIALAEGLLAVSKNAAMDDLMNAIAREFVLWSRSPDNDRAPGGTCMTGCRNLERGTPWREAGVAQSKGCGSAMRVAAIGIVWSDQHARLLEIARASSILTHGHPAGIEGAAAAALAVALAARGDDARASFDALDQECSPRSDDFARCWRRLDEFWDAPLDIALSSRGIGEAWVAEEAIASALWVYARYADDVRGGLLAGANTDGDSDSIACIAGSILGARWGLEAIPAEWRAGVESSAELHALAARLAEHKASLHQ